MRAILIATGFSEQMNALVRYRPTCLLNVADKPMIIYIIEFLFKEGIRHFDIILNHLPTTIEERLQDGKRWGISITYHLARDAHYPFAPMIPGIGTWEEERIILGNGDSLPTFKKNIFLQSNSPFHHFFYYPSKEWSGWALLTTSFLKTLNKNTTFEELPNLCKSEIKITVPPFLSTQSYQDLKASNLRIFSKICHLSTFSLTAHRVAPGIWISRNVSLHPHAKLKPPLFIGTHCQIASGVHLGPNTVIENNCMIGSDSKIENSIICQRSYVGENLEINDSIVDRNLLINLSYNTSIHIRDDFILSELSSISFLYYSLKFFSRLMAVFLLVLFSPIYLYLRITCRLIKVSMIGLPSDEDSAHWKSFNWLSFGPKNCKSLNAFQNYFKRLPLLINIIRGEASFVGVVPRSIKDVKKLPIDWQKLYLNSKVGLITLFDLNHGPYQTEDDLYAAETVYSTQMSPWFDFKVFFKWLKFKILILFKDRNAK
jgi:hypothetical protein